MAQQVKDGMFHPSEAQAKAATTLLRELARSAEALDRLRNRWSGGHRLDQRGRAVGLAHHRSGAEVTGSRCHRCSRW